MMIIECWLYIRRQIKRRWNIGKTTLVLSLSLSLSKSPYVHMAISGTPNSHNSQFSILKQSEGHLIIIVNSSSFSL